MKKILKYLIFLTVIILPIKAQAFGIDKFYVNATIENNGDLTIEEYFNMEGTFNGVDRDYDFKVEKPYPFNPNSEVFGGSEMHNGNNVEIIKIMGVRINDDFDFINVKGDTFKLVKSANKGDYGVYTERNTLRGKSYRIFLNNNKKKAFYIKYRISNLAIKHLDVGEFGWNIFSKNFRESIGHFKGTINIPNNGKMVKVWGHGPLHGNTKIINNEKVEITINNLNAYTAIDIRCVFDKNVIKDSKKETKVNALNKIIGYEEDEAKKSNYIRENDKKMAEINARFAIDYFRNTLSRYDYEEACRKIRLIDDYKLRDKLFAEVDEIKLLMFKKEEEHALEVVAEAEALLNYHNYKSAVDATTILNDGDIKKECLKRIEKIKEKIIKQEKKNDQIRYTAIGIITLGSILITAYVYFKYDKERRSTFNQHYLRDIPAEELPTTVSYLFKKKINDNAITAHVLDLIRRKIIKQEKIDDKNFKLKLLVNVEDLDELDKRLVKLLFNKSTEMELSKLKKYAKKDYEAFYDRWNNYYKKALRLGKGKEFYEEKINKVDNKKDNRFVFFIIGIALFTFLPFISLILWGIAGFKTIKNSLHRGKAISIAMYVVCIISLLFIILTTLIFNHFIYTTIPVALIIAALNGILIIYASKCGKRTQKGADEYAKWSAFKRFLKDFGDMDAKGVQEVSLWEKYLVYATYFGCAKKILKILEINQSEFNNLVTNYNYYDINHFNRLIHTSIHKSINAATSHHQSITSSSSSRSGGGFHSSGSGGGGGFSSSGGSFGGGSGGGRF